MVDIYPDHGVDGGYRAGDNQQDAAQSAAGTANAISIPHYGLSLSKLKGVRIKYDNSCFKIKNYRKSIIKFPARRDFNATVVSSDRDRTDPPEGPGKNNSDPPVQSAQNLARIRGLHAASLRQVVFNRLVGKLSGTLAGHGKQPLGALFFFSFHVDLQLLDAAVCLAASGCRS